MTELTLTTKELVMLGAFYAEGLDCMGGETLEQLRDDNMSWMSASDLRKVLRWSSERGGGVMSALDSMGLIVDSGESARDARDTDWYADLNRDGVDEELFQKAIEAYRAA